MTARYGVGIVGVGWVAGQHVRAFGHNPATEVVALCGRDRPAVEARRVEWGLECAVYTRYDDLLADPAVDVVAICTPNYLHAQQTVAAARAGKHLLIEKPPALNHAELEAAQQAVRAAGVKTVAGFVLRWNPLARTLKQLVQDGALGRLVLLQVDYWNNSARAAVPGFWVTRRAFGGSAFLTGGCHAVDAMRWLAGDEIVAVQAAAAAHRDRRYEFPTTVVALAHFAGGAVGKLSACLEGRLPYQFNIDLIGDRGSARDNRLWTPERLPGQTDWAAIPTILPNSGDVAHHPFQGEIDHLVDCIRDDRESFVNLDDAAKTVRVCLAVDEALASGQLVRLKQG